MNVYVAFQNNYDDYKIIGIFSSLEKAAEALDIELDQLHEHQNGSRYLKKPGTNWGGVGVFLSEIDTPICFPDYSDWWRNDSSASIKEKLDRIFAAAENERFEPGSESQLSRELSRFIDIYRQTAMSLIEDAVFNAPPSESLIEEILLILGKIPTGACWQERTDLLIRALELPMPYMRDSAVSGLCLLENPYAIPFLKVALEREAIKDLKVDIQQAMDYLKTLE